MNQYMTRRKALTALAGVMGLLFTKSLFASDKDHDGVSSATGDSLSKATATSRVLLVLVSLHHNNTGKVANIMAQVLNAHVKRPEHINAEELRNYDLIGFGSGIYDQKHHQSMLDLVEMLPNEPRKKVFIFSTSGISRKTCLKHALDDPHTVIREKLRKKNCTVLDEFNCVGWNTNVFLKYFGGINKKRPNADDLTQAIEFAENLRY
jgi:flavodoxin